MLNTTFCLNDQATLAPKREILTWMSKQSKKQLNSIEELGKGVTYCKIMSRFFPKTINQIKIKQNPINEWECTSNLKLVQLSFERLGIQKQINIEKLSHLRFQDNLEFAQWFMRFWELNFEDSNSQIQIKTKNKRSVKKEKLDKSRCSEELFINVIDHKIFGSAESSEFHQNMLSAENNQYSIADEKFELRQVESEVLSSITVKKIRSDNQKDQIDILIGQLSTVEGLLHNIKENLTEKIVLSNVSDLFTQLIRRLAEISS